MEHSPNFVKPKEVNRKDRAIIESIDDTLGVYDRYVEDHRMALEGTREYIQWLRGEQNGYDTEGGL